MASGIVPSLFKSAIVHPVYKGQGKDSQDPGSYRPVAILPSFIIVCSTIAMLYLDINLNIKNQNLLLFIKEKVSDVDKKGDIKI